ncbi:TonB-dependent receptor [Caballeronia sp. LjRoot34]|uniref:TonB-dependent receptor plug domain-containing protein n=1 Tax=Caballeronia sp. LjRoot34 TaxID=3342325 RepID=UPI003ECD5846
MKQKRLVTAIKGIIGAELVLSAAFIPMAYAQSSDQSTAAGTTGTTTVGAPAAATKLEKVEVTGSLIRTSDKVGTAEVQTITTKDIEQSGYTTVADFLRGISANSGSSWSQSTTNTTAPGGAGIALRGLSEKYTLVLVDGQRVANYANAVNFTDTFFDVNSIPLNIIDRVEVVKSGAVSQYGSDAIAGVVNIITKKTYQGLQIDGQLGKAQHPGDGQGNFSVLGGFGNLGTDRYNITGAVSWYRDTGSKFGDRDATSDQSFAGRDGGPTAPLTNQQSFWTTPGGKVPLTPCLPGQTTDRTGNTCVINTANALSLMPATTRLNAKLRGTVQVTDDIQAYADLWASRNETVQALGYTGMTSSSNVWDPTTNSILPLNRTVPASNPYNPFGVATPLSYIFPTSMVGVDAVSTYWKASTGVKGSFTTPKFGDWDWKLDAGHSQSTVSSTYFNSLNVAGIQNVLNNGTYNFANPSATPNGLNGLFQNDYQLSISKLDAVSAQASTGNLFTLPAGNVGLGLGTEFRHESSVINPRTYSSLGIVAPANIQSVDGSRNVAAVFYQVDIPIFRALTFTQSGRYDHYSDFGGAFSPSFALRYQPVQALTGFASYSRGFRAPTLVENSQASYIGRQTLNDPFAPGGPANIAATELSNGNPNLQPERTKNFNLGFALSPDSTTDIGGGFYKITIDGVIGTSDPQALLNANNPASVVRNPDGSLGYIKMPFVNLGSLDTDGFDFNWRKTLGTAFGNFTLAGDWQYVWHYKLRSPGADTQDLAGNNLALNQPFGASNPRWKGNTSLSWDYRRFLTTLSWQYTGPYANTIASSNDDRGSYGVGSYSQFNLYTSYRGFKNWTVYGGINNVFDKRPPFDVVWTEGQNQSGYDSSLYSAIGRTFQIGATYRFK